MVMIMMMMLILIMLELLSIGPETVVLNADAVYVTTYSVLHLTMTLHRSAYFTNNEKSLPLSEVLFRCFGSKNYKVCAINSVSTSGLA